jgi:hypothetical protein
LATARPGGEPSKRAKAPRRVRFRIAVVPPEEGLHFVLQDEMDSAAAGIIDFAAANGNARRRSRLFRRDCRSLNFSPRMPTRRWREARFVFGLTALAPVGWSTIRRFPQVGGTGIVGTDKAYIPITGTASVSACSLSIASARLIMLDFSFMDGPGRHRWGDRRQWELQSGGSIAPGSGRQISISFNLNNNNGVGWNGNFSTRSGQQYGNFFPQGTNWGLAASPSPDVFIYKGAPSFRVHGGFNLAGPAIGWITDQPLNQFSWPLGLWVVECGDGLADEYSER